MQRIRRYVLLEVLGPTLAALLVYTLLFLINLIFQLADLVIRNQLPLRVVGKFLALSLPAMLVLTVPMSILLGILVGVSRLSADSEMTALRACGVSYLQILPPLLALGLLGAAVAGTSSMILVPEANYTQHRMNAELFLSGSFARNIKPRIFYRDIPGVVLYADDADANGILRDVILFQRTESGIGQMTVAESLQIDQDSRTGVTRFFLHDGETHELETGAPAGYRRTRFADQVFVRPPDAGILQFVETLKGPLPRNDRELSTLALIDRVRRPLAPDYVDRQKIRASIELHRRLAIPPAALIFALLGLPLGVLTRRGGRSSGFAISLAVVLAYWLTMSAGENLARSAVVPVWAAVWTPNIVFSALGLALTAWLVRDRRLPHFLSRLRLRLPRRSPHPSAARSVRPRRRRFAGGWRALLPERLDRYVLSHYLGIFLLVISSFYLLHLLSDLRTLLDDITAHESATAEVVLRYFALKSPEMIVTGLPLASLLATLLAFGVLERNQEVTAMKAAGLSLFRISLPVLLLGILLSVAQFALTDSVLPRANERAANLRAEIRESKPASTFGLRQWIFGAERRLYNFASYSRGRDEYQGVAIYRFAGDGSSRVAERIEAEGMRFRDGLWVLRNGWSRTFGAEGEKFEAFRRLTLDLPEDPAYFQREVRAPAQMSFHRLRRYIRDLRQGGYDVQELEVALHEKVSMSTVPAILILLGVTFSFHRGRQRGTLAGVGLAVILTIAFYVLLATGRALGGVGIIPPIAAAWSPPLLFASLGTFRMLNLPS